MSVNSAATHTRVPAGKPIIECPTELARCCAAPADRNHGASARQARRAYQQSLALISTMHNSRGHQVEVYAWHPTHPPHGLFAVCAGIRCRRSYIAVRNRPGLVRAVNRDSRCEDRDPAEMKDTAVAVSFMGKYALRLGGGEKERGPRVRVPAAPASPARALGRCCHRCRRRCH